jgi:hypothetical protein
VRSEVGIVIFDSRVPPGTGRGFYMRADATELAGDDVAAGIEVFNSRYREDAPGLVRITAADVTESAPHRVYRATAREAFVLSERDERIAVAL